MKNVRALLPRFDPTTLDLQLTHPSQSEITIMRSRLARPN